MSYSMTWAPERTQLYSERWRIEGAALRKVFVASYLLQVDEAISPHQLRPIDYYMYEQCVFVCAWLRKPHQKKNILHELENILTTRFQKNGVAGVKSFDRSLVQ